jgi:hypothetical protein
MITTLAEMWSVWGGLVLAAASGACWLVRKRLRRDDPDEVVWQYYRRNYAALKDVIPEEVLKLTLVDAIAGDKNTPQARHTAKELIQMMHEAAQKRGKK